MALPLLFSSECFALRAEVSYKALQPVYKKRDGGCRVEASADTPVGNWRARFFAEPSRKHQGFVHIRYCYNNKYWVFVHDGDDDRWYISAADEPNEELGSEGCTLFKPILDEDWDDKEHIRLQTYVRGHQVYASILASYRNFKPYLQINTQEDSPTESVFVFIGLSREKELPKYVAFKGGDGRYIQAKDADKVEFPLNPVPYSWESVREIFISVMKSKLFLQFDTDAIGDEGVFCTIITNYDGTVKIKSSETGYLWTLGADDWIQPAEDDYGDGDHSKFKVITGDGFVALQNLGNQRFCNRLDFDYYVNWDLLKANGHTITKSSQLVLEEPLFRREISDVKFHVEQARIHGNSLVSLGRRERSNATQVVQTGTFSFKKKTEVRGRWETLLSSNTAEVGTFGGIITMIPFVMDGQVTLSREAASSKRRTESKYGSEERTITQDFTVPPGKTVTAEFVAMQASCEVPYSYKRMDVLTNGETICTLYEDGIYTGVNQYKFQIIMTESDVYALH